MNLLALFCPVFALSGRGVEIKELNPSDLRLNLSFYESFEAINIGFILSIDRPTFEFQINKCDTSGLKNDLRANPVVIGAPLKLRNYNLFPVIVSPIFKFDDRTIRLQNLDLKLRFKRYQSVKLPPALAQVYRNLILNYDLPSEELPQGFLIITPNSFYNAVSPLADWKEKKGWKVTVSKLSETGNTSGAIKNYISNAYYTWNPPPEYVLLIGDKDSLPAYSYLGPVGATDYPYSLLEGDDFLAEVLIGRLSVSNVNELNTVVAKIIGYEKSLYTTDTIWFKRSLMVGANMPSNMTTPIPTKRWVREKFLEYGFSSIDTVFYPMAPVNITNSINQGVLFVNYRSGAGEVNAWPYPYFANSDVIALSNGWKLPIVTSITCLTGNFLAEPCFGEVWLRSGNYITPKGAVAFIGASAASTSSRWNNCLDYGIYWGILKEGVSNLGPALYRGKMEVFMNFPLDTTWNSGSSFYFHTFNLLGDPSLEFFTSVPKNFIVNHPSTIPVGTNSFTIQVLNSLSQPVEGALVSLYKKNEVKEVAYTKADGLVNFQITTPSPDTLFVTVTKHNYKPYCGYALVNNSAVYVGYYSHTIADPGGNNNGEINPDDTIQLAITLKNFGNSTTATNVTAKLTTSDPLITITDSIKNYGSIPPGTTANAPPFTFYVSSNIKNNHTIKFNLTISSSQGDWNSVLYLIAKAPEFSYLRCQILDGGNGILEPGEESDLTVSIKNIGGLSGSNINGLLRSTNPGVLVIDSLGSFGNIQVGDSATNSGNHFSVTASPQIAPGHKVSLLTILSGDNNFHDTIEFIITIGVVATNTPTGPDGYGYYAYDNTDTGYPEAPVYNWIEIDPELGGSGMILNLLNDETKTINLPFNFKFYGAYYNKVSISSNGYIAMNSTWIADMYNWHIPSAGGPPLLIAPFWDDLDPNATDSSGNVCYYYDATNHRFIIEWSRIQHIHNPTNPTPAELQTFEIILFDPAYYQTQTGDGEILFQYKKITNDDTWHNYATVGIEDYNHINGLEYSYANIYPPSAAPLANGRAIKFTTDQPDPFPGIKEASNLKSQIQDPKLSFYPNPFSEKLNISIKDTQKSAFLIKIYDATGRLVKSFNLESSIVWSGDDDLGRRLPAGVYFMELETEGHLEVQKVVLVK